MEPLRSPSTESAMSLSLLQGYSSAEEEAQHNSVFNHTSSDDDDEDLASAPAAAASTVTVNLSIRDKSLFELPQPSSQPGLPSAFDAFSEVRLFGWSPFILFIRITVLFLIFFSVGYRRFQDRPSFWIIRLRSMLHREMPISREGAMGMGAVGIVRRRKICLLVWARFLIWY